MKHPNTTQNAHTDFFFWCNTIKLSGKVKHSNSLNFSFYVCAKGATRYATTTGEMECNTTGNKKHPSGTALWVAEVRPLPYFVPSEPLSFFPNRSHSKFAEGHCHAPAENLFNTLSHHYFYLTKLTPDTETPPPINSLSSTSWVFVLGDTRKSLSRQQISIKIKTKPPHTTRQQVWRDEWPIPQRAQQLRAECSGLV